MIAREKLRTISDAKELVRRCVVPSREAKGAAARKTHHREDWCIARFVLRQLQAREGCQPILTANY